MTATTLSTEDALSAALDADPGNHLLRYALADCLEESAGAVDCGRVGTGEENQGRQLGYAVPAADGQGTDRTEGLVSGDGY